MKSYCLISALALLFGITSVHGQVNLTEMDSPSADSLQKSRIRYFSPGMGGRNKVWDFSKLYPKHLKVWGSLRKSVLKVAFDENESVEKDNTSR